MPGSLSSGTLLLRYMAPLTRQLSIDASCADVPFGANDQPSRAILRGSFPSRRQQAWIAVAAGGGASSLPSPFQWTRAGPVLRPGRAQGPVSNGTVTSVTKPRCLVAGHVISEVEQDTVIQLLHGQSFPHVRPLSPSRGSGRLIVAWRATHNETLALGMLIPACHDSGSAVSEVPSRSRVR